MANSNFVVQNGLTVGPLTIDAATGSINTPGTVTVTGNVVAGSGTTSTSTTTGALVVVGGVGVSGALNIGGATQAAAITSSGTIIASTVNAGTIGNASATLTGTLSTAAQNSVTTMTGLTGFGTASVVTTAAGHLTVTGNLTVNGTQNIINNTIYETTEYVVNQNATNGNIGTLAVTTGLSTANAVITGGSINNATVGATTHTTGRFTTVTATTVNAGTIGNSGATLTGTLSTAAQNNITSVGTLTGLTVSGAIVPNANLTIDLGSTSAWFNNVYGVSIQAKYADLAEIYTADHEYTPGTVVCFGGSNEITTSSEDHTPMVAGVISTQPAYLMNAISAGLPVALSGRVPCLVQGPVSKGDRLVNIAPGVAGRLDVTKYVPGCVIGHALNDNESTQIKLIEVVIMKF